MHDNANPRHKSMASHAQEQGADGPPTYTPAEFAALFGRSATWAYRRLYDGSIRRLKGSPRILIPKSEMMRFLQNLESHE